MGFGIGFRDGVGIGFWVNIRIRFRGQNLGRRSGLGFGGWDLGRGVGVGLKDDDQGWVSECELRSGFRMRVRIGFRDGDLGQVLK